MHNSNYIEDIFLMRFEEEETCLIILKINLPTIAKSIKNKF